MAADAPAPLVAVPLGQCFLVMAAIVALLGLSVVVRTGDGVIVVQLGRWVQLRNPRFSVRRQGSGNNGWGVFLEGAGDQRVPLSLHFDEVGARYRAARLALRYAVTTSMVGTAVFDEEGSTSLATRRPVMVIWVLGVVGLALLSLPLVGVQVPVWAVYVGGLLVCGMALAGSSASFAYGMWRGGDGTWRILHATSGLWWVTPWAVSIQVALTESDGVPVPVVPHDQGARPTMF